MLQNQTFLPSYQVLQTHSLDEARHAVAQRYCDHRLDLARGRHLNVQHNHARGVHVSLNLLGYGGDVEIDPGELKDFYLLQIPLSGSARVTHRSEEVDASSKRATILNPDRPTQMQWGEDCVKLMLQIDANYLQRVAQEILMVPVPGPVRFAPSVDLTKAGGLTLKSMAAAAATAIETGALPLSQQNLQLINTERELTCALLMHQPSNISHLLEAAMPGIATRQLKRAIDFIHDSYAEDIRLVDIAEAAELHARTLQSAFKDEFGMSPMTYLRNLRLDTARYYLMQRMNRPRVSDVAYDCGYSHLGRFSRDYRERFGQSPSELSLS